MSARLNRWLGASVVAARVTAPSGVLRESSSSTQRSIVMCTGVAIGLALLCGWLARFLPLGGLIASTTGWTVLLVTTFALAGSLSPAIRRLGAHGNIVGYPCLYVVLASMGAQASLQALITTPVWLAVGFGLLVFHAVLLLSAGRLLRIPFDILAVASQANVGGVVSAPLVGAVYDQALAPVGLILAIALNAAGTYLGLLAASLSRVVAGG